MVGSVVKGARDSKEIFHEAEMYFGRCIVLKTASELLWRPRISSGMLDLRLQCSPPMLLFSPAGKNVKLL